MTEIVIAALPAAARAQLRDLRPDVYRLAGPRTA